MTPKEKAKELVNSFKATLIILMDKDTECGNEALCTIIAKQSALIVIEEILSIKLLWDLKDVKELNYWLKVKYQINKL